MRAQAFHSLRRRPVRSERGSMLNKRVPFSLESAKNQVYANTFYIYILDIASSLHRSATVQEAFQ